MMNIIPNHHISHIKFIGSFPNILKAPRSSLPEIAFLGRSNVGKSSLLNYLCAKKKVAKTSGTPGKTQFINLFDVDNKWMLADLPGYGYARISKKIRKTWQKMIHDYLLLRENLYCAFLLIDVRLSPQDLDLQQIRWLGDHQIPFVIVFTKIDKLKSNDLKANVNNYLTILSQEWEELPRHFLSSTTKKIGRDEIMQYIAGII